MSKDLKYHDWAHAKNVYRNAQTLLKYIQGDEIVVLTSALFHDIARDKENHELEGANILKDLLNDISEFPKDKIEETCLAVLHHEQGQISNEEKILSDADKMDAFNELGIGRGFMMAAKKGYPLKEAALGYLDLLNSWYNGFHFDKSKEIIKDNYDSTKKILEKMLNEYKL